MPYYVYTFWRGQDAHTGATGRQFLTFPNKEAADLLFRGLQENVPVKVYGGGRTITEVERLAHNYWNIYGDAAGDAGWHMYNLIDEINSANASVKNLKFLEDVRGKVSLILMADHGGRDMPVIRDCGHGYGDGNAINASGDTAYIRSKLYPDQYWYAPREGHVELSTNKKSKFRITVADTKVDDAVIVGSDKVHLSVVSGGYGEYPVYTDAHRHLVTGGTGLTRDIPFSAFNGGIEGDRAYGQNEDRTRLILVHDQGDSKTKFGEDWVLC